MQDSIYELDRLQRIRRINLQLAALGQQTCATGLGGDERDIADYLRDTISTQRKGRLSLCPADVRIQNYLDDLFYRYGLNSSPILPTETFMLTNPGIAEELSLPLESDSFRSKFINSYRVKQGVLHNPVKDRRTTKGVFHVVEGGLAIPDEKKAVPVPVFFNLLTHALNPSTTLMNLPFSSRDEFPAALWVSLLLRPTVCPPIHGYAERKSLEVRFFAPGGLVANLDFVERIFGNAGNPFKFENDAALDIQHWTGHTGCVILAPELTELTKKELGLPNYDSATDRQRRDNMCWRDESEKYNDGQAFKVTCRDNSGVIVTVIADNYFGYSKKEIKSHISYSANLFGGCEEEHSGGALAFPSYNLGDHYELDRGSVNENHTLDKTVQILDKYIDLQVEGYATDKKFPEIVYIPENARLSLYDQTVSWEQGGELRQIKLLADHIYVFPSGYKVHMERHPFAPTWRLIGTEAEGTLCHKPSTVSGGGKSEIAKSISDTVIFGSLYVDDIENDFNVIQEVFDRDYSDRFKRPPETPDQRSLLSAERSLGSVIRLLTPSEKEYTAEYNEWLMAIPQHIRALVFIIKRFYRSEWEGQWREKFSVDIVNGYDGHELKYDGRKLVASYLRIGRQSDGSWRLHKLRQDFIPSHKVQTADDITASVTVPAQYLDNLNREYAAASVKLIENCETHLFQRPDDAVHRGLDKQTEADLAQSGNFMSNFEPMNVQNARELVDNIISFSQFTQPMQDLICEVANSKRRGYFVSSAHSRLVNGVRSPNMRYLQLRPDFADKRATYIADIGTRLSRQLSSDQVLNYPVNAVLQGQRNNPQDKKNNIPALAVYNPIHYQELPELFMNFICSLTGKSPSTTGAGSEGALTKGPFNSLCAVTDLNNALVSFILCGFDGYSSAAGYVGPDNQVGHDISLLIPEIWCRLSVQDRDPRFLIANGYLERLDDFEYEGCMVSASRLGYRINKAFVHAYFGKIFDNPTDVFDDAMLKPELQDMKTFVDGISTIVDAQREVALHYFNDGSIEYACPPLKALLYIMAKGEYDGMDLHSPELRSSFTREHLLVSDWYQHRLRSKQLRDVDLWQKHVAYIQRKIAHADSIDTRDNLELLLVKAKEGLQDLQGESYLEKLQGTIGADSLY